jgi:hypothetical protein
MSENRSEWLCIIPILACSTKLNGSRTIAKKMSLVGGYFGIRPDPKKVLGRQPIKQTGPAPVFFYPPVNLLPKYNFQFIFC